MTNTIWVLILLSGGIYRDDGIEKYEQNGVRIENLSSGYHCRKTGEALTSEHTQPHVEFVCIPQMVLDVLSNSTGATK